MLLSILILYFFTSSRGINCLLTDHGINIKTHTLDLSGRHLTEIPPNIPVDTEILDLSNNEIQIIPNGIFANLSRLIHLNLYTNIINVILPDSFEGLSRLESLNLQSNRLSRESLRNESFKPLTSLIKLYIGENFIMSSDSAVVFSDEIYQLRLLDTLSLDWVETNQNPLNKFECFKILKSLEFLDTAMIVTNKTFEKLRDLPIEELSIITFRSAENNAFSFFPKLLKLTLRLTWEAPSLQKIFPALEAFKGRNMTKITLSNNLPTNFFRLDKSHLQYLWDICLKELYLTSDNIFDIDAASFLTFARKSDCLEVLDMSDNPLIIDDMYLWTMSLHFLKKLKVIRFSHFGFRPSTESLMKMNIQNAFTFGLPSTLQEASITDGPLTYGLPNITLLNGQSMKILILVQFRFSNCLGSFNGLQNLTMLDISGFNCNYLNPEILQFLPRLEHFTARNTNLNYGLSFDRDSGARLFVHLFNLNYIDLSANNLRSLHSDMFKDQQEMLRYLNLSNNAFKNIPISINKFKLLEMLDLTSNGIEYFDNNEQEMLEKNINIDIRLAGNPFACTCDHINFLRWIKDRGLKFFVNVECIGEERLQHNISELISSLDNFELHCVITFWLYFAITLLSVSGLLLLFVSLYYRYRSEIQYFFLKLRIQMKRYSALEEDEYQFDAFISYSSSDSSWVIQFYRQLTDTGFKLCIDYKDFIAGDGIAENIVKAIDSSRKIIFIVTRNFLQSSWGGYEIEMTRMHAFREGRENMVVLILKDDIPINEMPRILQEMWNKIVCLKYYDQDETGFYDAVALCLR